MKKFLFFATALIFSCHLSLLAQNPSGMTHPTKSHVMMNTTDLKWEDGPPGLPKGVKVVVLEGDPSKEGMFTLRAIMPANYKIPAHWHPTTEHVTVLEGDLYMGMGESLDEQRAIQLKTGGFSSLPAKTAHYAFTKEGCTIQVHAMGPFEITYINPADDPRKK
ncbi:cupin domain-containing protein [Terrimonas alba]|uniref:cupin domain-containing protein n=1 Tax=Terrimonas alba TaxID=3349636 RepID=UPI0035F2A086